MSSPLRYVLDGIHCEPRFTVPLDHQQPDDEETLTLFGRTSVARTGCTTICPGCCSCRVGPALVPASDRRQRLDQGALQEFRAAARSARHRPPSPISAEALAQLTAPQQAEYLGHFRADSIVRDAEYIREVLSPGAPEPARPELAAFAASPTSPCSRTACTRSTSPAGWPHRPPCRRGLPRHLPASGGQEPRLLRPFPHAQAIANRLANHLHSHEVRLPNGQRLTVEQLQQQGLDLVPAAPSRSSTTCWRTLHRRAAQPRLPLPSAGDAAVQHQPGVRHPARVHLLRGKRQQLGSRAGEKRIPGPGLGAGQGFRLHRRDDLPLMFEQFRELIPLKEAAHLLAQKADWGPLRPGAAGPQHCAGGLRRLCRGHVRGVRLLPRHPQGAWQQPRLDHQRIRTQRPAGRW